MQDCLLHCTQGGGGRGGGYSTQSWVSTVKLMKKEIAVNLHGSSYRSQFFRGGD